MLNFVTIPHETKLCNACHKRDIFNSDKQGFKFSNLKGNSCTSTHLYLSSHHFKMHMLNIYMHATYTYLYLQWYILIYISLSAYQLQILYTNIMNALSMHMHYMLLGTVYISHSYIQMAVMCASLSIFCKQINVLYTICMTVDVSVYTTVCVCVCVNDQAHAIHIRTN